MKYKDESENNNNNNNGIKELEEIKNSYYEFEEMYTKNEKIRYISTNSLIYHFFNIRLEKIILGEKFIKLKEKINNYSGDKNLEQEKEKINYIITESNKMKNEAKEEDEYYDKILEDLYSSERKFGKINDVERTYDNICQDIIDSRINKYLKYEKKLIHFNDLIKDLSELNIN